MPFQSKLKNSSRNNPVSGFTLVEALVVVFIFTVLALGVSAIIVTIFNNFKQQSAALDNVDKITMLSAKFTNEIRNAAYGSDGSYPLNSAGDFEIIFFSSSNGDGTTVYKIRYWLSGTTLYKGVTAPVGSPSTYPPEAVVITKIQDDVVNMSGVSTPIPLFYYYDGNYSGSGNFLSQPVNINDVKFVKINLIVLKQPEVNPGVTFNFNTGATIRNLKNNLGN